MSARAGISSAVYRSAGSTAGAAGSVTGCCAWTSAAGSTIERTASEMVPSRPRMVRAVRGDVRRLITAVLLLAQVIPSGPGLVIALTDSGPFCLVQVERTT